MPSSVLWLQPFRLPSDRLNNMRMAVAVDDGPQRRHPVDIPPPLGVDEAVPLGPLDNQLRLTVEAGPSG